MIDFKQKYNEALSRARKIHNETGFDYDKGMMEEIFPELKEPMNDEMIRNRLLEYFKSFTSKTFFNGIRTSDAITWLEKQDKPLLLSSELKESSEDERIKDAIIATIHLYYGEPLEDEAKEMIAWLEKPLGKTAREAAKEAKIDNANKVEPKFKVGDWYQCIKDFFGKGVTFDKNTVYYCAKEGCLQGEYGCHIAIVRDLYDNFKLWTIQEAKDGDVLVNGSNIFIFSNLSGTRAMGYCHVNLDDGKFYDDRGDDECFGLIDAVFTPANDERRACLFAKMKEAGYEWDAEKKELRKVMTIEENLSLKDHCARLPYGVVLHHIPSGETLPWNLLDKE